MPGLKTKDPNKILEEMIFGIKGEDLDLEFSQLADYYAENFPMIDDLLKIILLGCVKEGLKLDLSEDTKFKLFFLKFAIEALN